MKRQPWALELDDLRLSPGSANDNSNYSILIYFIIINFICLKIRHDPHKVRGKCTPQSGYSMMFSFRFKCSKVACDDTSVEDTTVVI